MHEPVRRTKGSILMKGKLLILRENEGVGPR